MCVFGIGSAGIGAGILLSPYTMYANFKVLSDILPIPGWGGLWLATGLLILAGLLLGRYALCKIGMIAVAGLCVALAMAQFTGQFFGDTGVYSFMSTVIYASSAITAILVILEPPINPETAIRGDRTE